MAPPVKADPSGRDGGGAARPSRHTTVRTIEAVLAELGLPPAQCSLPSYGGPPSWGAMKGSAEVYVFLHEGEHDDWVQVIAPMFFLPEPESARLYRRLLELNGTDLGGLAFGIRDNRVVLTAERPATDLTQGELRDLVLRVGACADQLDDVLVAEFGGRRHTDV